MGNSDSSPPIQPGTVTEMKIADIRFTHDSISRHFSNGVDLAETYDDILSKRLDVSSRGIDPITVMYHDGYWWVVRGNRRLYLYKHLYKKGYLTTCLVRTQLFNPALFHRQHSSANSGLSVRIRGHPNFEKELDILVKRYEYDNRYCTIL